MRYTSLESLRAVAAIMIVVFHTPFILGERNALIQNSALFVDFFFVLSGFVMTHAYRDRIVSGLRSADYLILRLGRLLPLHLAIMLTWLAALALLPFFGESTPSLEARHTSASFLVNLFLVNSIGVQSFLSWNYPSWSIGAELVAYVLFFFVVGALGRNFRLGHALLISLVAFALLVVDDSTTIRRTFDLGAVRCVGGFFLGVAVYQMRERFIDPTWRPGTLIEMASIASVVASLAVAFGPAIRELVVVVAFALVVLTFSSSQGHVSRFLNFPGPVYLGKISYSIYMVHALVIFVVSQIVAQQPGVTVLLHREGAGIRRLFLQTELAPVFVVGVVAIVVAISAFTYRYIEEPFRLLSRKIVFSQGTSE